MKNWTLLIASLSTLALGGCGVSTEYKRAGAHYPAGSKSCGIEWSTGDENKLTQMTGEGGGYVQVGTAKAKSSVFDDRVKSAVQPTVCEWGGDAAMAIPASGAWMDIAILRKAKPGEPASPQP